MNHPPTGTSTFLFTDIEGSSRMWEQHPDAMGASLAAHDAIVGGAIARHGGYIFSRGGDAFAAAFARVTGAVDAALEARRELAGHDWGVAEIRVRMGIHTGEAEERDGDYFGRELNRAARLMATANGGQVVLSGRTADLVGDRMLSGCQLVDRGVHRLKDVREPIHVYEVVDTELPYDVPPLLLPNTGNLPASLTELVGRDEEVTELVELLSGVRLVNLIGPGGVGKTRLALEVAGHLGSMMPNGAWFVGLSEINEPALVVKQLASALSIEERADEPVIDTVIDALGDHELLLVFDNCEHLLDAAAEVVERLTTSVSGLRVLATSRAPLDLRGERLWLVPALGLPAADEAPLTSPAVRLFLDRARLVLRHFDPGDADLAACVEICRRVDGLPLAIELAAARVAVLAPGEIAERIGDRMDLLAVSARDVEKRQQTMRATVAWSHDLLSEDEQAMFRSLAVFRGGFTLDAARAVVDPGGPIDGVAAGIERLVNQSLLHSTPAAGSRRFTMLETVRAHAAERLAESGEADEMQRRHRDHFVGWAADQAKRLTTSAQLDALDRLEADHDNLRAVLTRSFDSGDMEAAVGLAADMSFFWWLHAHFAESGVWYDRLMGSTASVSEWSSAKFLLGAGQMAIGVRDYEGATRRLRAARRLATDAGAERVAAWAIAGEMTMASYRLRLDEARELAQEAMGAFEAIGDVAGAGYVAFVDVAIDFAESWTADELTVTVADGLLERLEPLVAAAGVLGERNFLGHINELTGSINLLVGRESEAVEPLTGAIESLDALGSQSCLAHVIERVALFAARTGDLRGAVRLSGAAGSVRRRIGAKRSEAEEEVSRRVLDMARAELGASELDEARKLGAAASRPDAVALALDALGGD